MKNRHYVQAILFVTALFFVGCNSESEEPLVVHTQGLTPNPHGFKFRNYGDILEEDITADDVAMLHGSENVCYNKSATNCTLTAMGNYHKKKLIEMQEGGQCYGIAVASSMFYDGSYAFKGKYLPSDYNPNARNAFDLNKSDVANFIAVKFANQLTPQVAQRFQQCQQSDMREEYYRVVEGFSSDDPIAVVAFFNMYGEMGHGVTPFKIEQRGSKAKMYVYDNNFPGDDSLYFDIDLDKGTWSYIDGRVNFGAPPTDTYKGENRFNPFCTMSLSLTQFVELENENTLDQDTLSFDLSGDANSVRLLVQNSEGQSVGYDAITDSYKEEIEGYIQERRLDNMPPVYKIPKLQTFTNIELIDSNETAFENFFDELFYAKISALETQEGDAGVVSLSTDIKTEQFHSALMFDNLFLDANSSFDVAFHPGGRFMLFENRSAEQVAPPIVHIYFDDFEGAKGAMHEIAFSALAPGLSVGIVIESVDSLEVFSYSESNNSLVPLNESDYSIDSLYVDANSTNG